MEYIKCLKNMNAMFRFAASLNKDISAWDTSHVMGVSHMFSVWDMSSVTNMDQMFYDAASFNKDISAWDTSSVRNMCAMPIIRRSVGYYYGDGVC
jgi:surface protein